MRILLVFSLAVLASCTTTTVPVKTLTPVEEAYISRVQKASPRFTMAKPEAEVAWSRGVEFVEKFSDLKIEESSLSVLKSQDPNKIPLKKNEFMVPVGYKIFRKSDGNQTRFAVTCLHPKNSAVYTSDLCDLNARIAAHYMETGELMGKFVNTQKK